MKAFTIGLICLFGFLIQINSVVSKLNLENIVFKNQLNDYDVKKKVILTPDAPKPIGPYNQAVQINYMIYLSGQIGINPATGQLVSDDVRNQTQQAFINIKAVLNAAGADLNQIARCLVLLTDMNDFQSVNQIYASFFPSTEDYPARSTFAVKTLPANAKVEIECTAYTMKE
ncbi:unnamed protein product [Rotaria magnacalcarata]|uniref:Uncharacterized protein n=2 Tax=Rotaria magnacalcarata TaxID=392030 RepID=A0A816MR34_9BILA|nr:unnamed protein product [Rotaria magnacalcarata]CAF1593134.1 unnamed protein product [Rotaria magnacalcarata]CAF1923487.1 unnamed protein product [Rotaria magnacalcarata]CAF1995144.1 unnamed protein product [Rotaria magnacalcarata]CAF2053057.1 unnamed protein product [Rotaria magnacalcarata]